MLELPPGKPDLAEVAHHDVGIEHAHDHLLAEGDAHRRDAQLDLALAARRLDAPVLRPPLLGDVEAGEHLEARDHRRVHHLGQRVDLVQHAVDAHAHDRLVALRLDVDVAGALVECVVQEVLDGVDDLLSVASMSSTRLSCT